MDFIASVEELFKNILGISSHILYTATTNFKASLAPAVTLKIIQEPDWCFQIFSP